MPIRLIGWLEVMKLLEYQYLTKNSPLASDDGDVTVVPFTTTVMILASQHGLNNSLR
jgi:hypothetical protein